MTDIDVDDVLAPAPARVSDPQAAGRSELDASEAEHEFLLTAFMAMLNPKERS